MITAYRRKIQMRSERGQSLVEFALALPILVLLLFAVIQFGIAFNNYVTLTDATRAGARKAAVGRQLADPVGACVTAIRNSATDLRQADLSPSCSSSWQPGADVSVTATYPYTINLLGIPVKTGACRARPRSVWNESSQRSWPGNRPDRRVPGRTPGHGGPGARHRIVVPRRPGDAVDRGRRSPRGRAGAAGRQRNGKHPGAAVRDEERRPRLGRGHVLLEDRRQRHHQGHRQARRPHLLREDLRQEHGDRRLDGDGPFGGRLGGQVRRADRRPLQAPAAQLQGACFEADLRSGLRPHSPDDAEPRGSAQAGRRQRVRRVWPAQFELRRSNRKYRRRNARRLAAERVSATSCLSVPITPRRRRTSTTRNSRAPSPPCSAKRCSSPSTAC